MFRKVSAIVQLFLLPQQLGLNFLVLVLPCQSQMDFYFSWYLSFHVNLSFHAKSLVLVLHQLAHYQFCHPSLSLFFILSHVYTIIIHLHLPSIFIRNSISAIHCIILFHQDQPNHFLLQFLQMGLYFCLCVMVIPNRLSSQVASPQGQTLAIIVSHRILSKLIENLKFPLKNN